MTLRRLLPLCACLLLGSPAQAQLADDFLDLPGRLTDSRDQETYATVEIAGREWLAENLRYRPEDSEEIWCYQDRPPACERHGMLYSWDAALEACPPGWRLPGRGEWEGLMESLGGPELAAKALAPGGTSGLELDLSGYREGDQSVDLGDVGLWWSGDRQDETRAWGIRLQALGAEDLSLGFGAHVIRGFGEEPEDRGVAASVRCVR